jgi:copper resistance protein B
LTVPVVVKALAVIGARAFAATVLLARVAVGQESMPYREMADMMQMDDRALFGKVMFDQLEWRNGGAGESRAAWDWQGWYGGDYDKLWVKTEGQYVAGAGGVGSVGGAAGGASGDHGAGVHDASVDALWDRVVSRWWNVQVGGRQDFGPGQARTWAAFGVQGLAPQWFETEATLYASDAGRTAARLKAQYDVLLTQRLVLQPFVEVNLYGRSDPQRQLGSGLSDLEASLRLRYELNRRLAPYVGVAWLRRFGGTADFAHAEGGRAAELLLSVGLKAWL